METPEQLAEWPSFPSEVSTAELLVRASNPDALYAELSECIAFATSRNFGQMQSNLLNNPNLPHDLFIQLATDMLADSTTLAWKKALLISHPLITERMLDELIAEPQGASVLMMLAASPKTTDAQMQKLLAIDHIPGVVLSMLAKPELPEHIIQEICKQWKNTTPNLRKIARNLSQDREAYEVQVEPVDFLTALAAQRQVSPELLIEMQSVLTQEEQQSVMQELGDNEKVEHNVDLNRKLKEIWANSAQ